MQADFSRTLKGLDGKDLALKGEDGTETVLTVGAACINALMAAPPDDRSTGEEKLKRYRLGMKILNGAGAVNVTAEEVTMLKGRVGEVHSPLVVGQVYDALDPPEPAPEE